MEGYGVPVFVTAMIVFYAALAVIGVHQWRRERVYKKLAMHCIGLDRKKPYTRHGRKYYRPYRNYFMTGREHENWDKMVAAGYAERDSEQNQHGGYTYHLTEDGRKWLGDALGVCILDEWE